LLAGGKYYDLPGTLAVMKRILSSSAVDGFEFQDLAEWDSRGPPRDVVTKSHRTETWKSCPKYSLEERTKLVKSASVISVHANRDVGICLCSEDMAEIDIGRSTMNDTFRLAKGIGAQLVVFHLWDTYATNFDPAFLKSELKKASSGYPLIVPSVENVPTHLEGSTPLDLASMFDFITLDTRWAGLYDELDEFQEVSRKIVNVHLRGSLEGNEWTLHDAPYTFEEAFGRIRNEWGICGPYTVEPERGNSIPMMEDIISSLKTLKRYLGQA
jgi:hypothetical protein